MFSFSKFCQTSFPNGCTNLYSFQQCLKFPVFLHLHQHNIINPYYFGHSDAGVVVSHCNFNLCSLKKYLLNLLSTDYVPGLDLGEEPD